MPQIVKEKEMMFCGVTVNVWIDRRKIGREVARSGKRNEIHCGS